METKTTLRQGLLGLVAALAAAAFFLAAVHTAPAAAAEETVWICKPGMADDLCAGSITTRAGAETIGFDRPVDPPVDCFYIYPTVSEQDTPNANLDKDPEVQRVIVQQARMFSRVCDVYAPMYRQATSPYEYDETIETAYQSALAGWKDYLENYNDGRGVILVGHSQGSATLGRLIDEEIDPDPELRKRLVGAILPGGNIYVPKGKLVGGMYDHIPVCSKVGEFGCLVAYSMYNGAPGDDPLFGDVGSGYWAYKVPRPDRAANEVVCADPAMLSGRQHLTTLMNMDYLLGAPEGGVESNFWKAFPDQGHSACERQGTKHWLNVGFNEGADPLLTSLIPVVASGNNWHVPEVNVAEENLIQIARLQADSYLAQADTAKLKQKLKALNGRLAKANRGLAKAKATGKKIAKQLRRAKGAKKAALKRRVKSNRKAVAAAQRQISSLKRQIAQVKRRIG